MHNFKSGDLAVITRQVETVMAGSVVEIKRLWARGKGFRSSRTGDIITVAEDSYFFGHPSLEGDLVGFAAARFFVPLTGDFKPDEDDLAEYAETSFYDLRTGRQHLLGGRP